MGRNPAEPVGWTSLWVPLFLGGSAKICLSHGHPFLSTCKLPASFWNFRPLRPSPLSKMAYKPQMPNAASLDLIFMTPSACTSVINFGHFLLFICLVWIWRSARLEELGRWEESCFLCPHVIYLMGSIERVPYWWTFQSPLITWLLRQSCSK